MPTPKERYDARQKLKKIARDPGEPNDSELKDEYMLNLVERFVSSVERIADALERQR